jgi:hypothetical protein
MLELCMATYYAIPEPLLENYFRAGVGADAGGAADNGMEAGGAEAGGSGELLAELSRVIGEIAHAVTERGRGLADSESGAFTPAQHAIMFALFAKNILEVFGREEGDRLLLAAVEQYGEERGRRMAQRCSARGKVLDMDSYLAFTEWRYAKDFEKTPLFDEPYRAYRILRCPWVLSWKGAGLAEFGKYYCRVVDKAILKGFNPRLSLEMPSRLSDEGAEYCEFHWKDLVVDGAQSARVAAISAEIGESCVKDFIYHTAHIYSTISACARRWDSVKGKEASLRARKDFIEKCSYQEWLRVLALTNMDFNAV